MQIRVETEQLQEISDGLQVKKEGFETLVTEMKGLVDRIPDAWAGTAAEAYIGQFEELQPTFNNVTELIDTISSQIAQVINASEELDSDIASILNQ